MKAINEEFIHANSSIQKQKEELRRREDQVKKNDRYTYFPFVSGELIEKHRATLGAQLKNDLQSYLDYQKINNQYSS